MDFRGNFPFFSISGPFFGHFCPCQARGGFPFSFPFPAFNPFSILYRPDRIPIVSYKLLPEGAQEISGKTRVSKPKHSGQLAGGYAEKEGKKPSIFGSFPLFSRAKCQSCLCLNRVHTKGVMQQHAILRRVLTSSSNSKCFLEGFLEGACKGFQ